MKNLVMALIFPLAMGMIFVSCNTSSDCKTKETIKETFIKDKSVYVFGDSRDSDLAVVTTTSSTTKKQTTTECDCLEVEKKFAEIKENRNSTYSTATAQLRAELENKPSCLKFDGDSSWSCGKYSGRDSGNTESQLVMGGF